MNHDLIIIGGGPAGYLAAEKAGRAGLKTLLIEERGVGGVCLNEGCIPSKTLLYSAKLYEQALNGQKYGVAVTNPQLNHTVVVDRKNKVVRTLLIGIKDALKKSGVVIFEGRAQVVGKGEEGFLVRSGEQVFEGSRLLIATGSVPVIPPLPGIVEGLERGFVVTSRELLGLRDIPSSLVILGGGVIGLEMAAYFSTAGSQVTVVEMLDHIAGATDGEIGGMLLKHLQKRGVSFKLSAKVTEIREKEVCFESEGKTQTLTAEKVLLSVGRRPATQGLGLETLGVQIEGDKILTDEFGRTSIPGVYGAGDVNGISMLAHTAYREAEVCVHHMLGIQDTLSYQAIPAVIYTQPEVGGVGETEETARQKGLDYEAAKLSLRFSGRFLAENEGGDGLCKVLVERSSRRLIGVHILGSYASEMIYGAAVMIEQGMRIDDIKRVVFPHPTVSEILRETLLRIEG